MLARSLSWIVHSLAEIKKSEKENPEAIQEVPIIGSDFGGDGLRELGLFKFTEGHIEQGTDAAEKMQPVERGENVEEAAGLIRGDVETFDDKLAPGDKLANQKEDAESGGPIQILRNWWTSPKDRRRRAASMTTLLESKTIVLNQTMEGRWSGIQL